MKKDNTLYERLKKDFTSGDVKSGLYTFFEPEALPLIPEKVMHFMSACKRNGVCCAIPELPDSDDYISDCKKAYSLIADSAMSEGLRIGVNFDRLTENRIFGTKEHEDIRGRVLVCREFFYEPFDRIKLKLPNGDIMSVVAYDDGSKEIIDLRQYVSDRVLDYTLPQGNWVIEVYLCVDRDSACDSEVLFCDILSYSDSMKYFKTAWETLTSEISDISGSVGTVYVGDMGFNAPNRRNWTSDFNREFEQEHKIDPSPLYPVLYHNVGPRTRHYKALFMHTRARLFREGFIRALKDFSDSIGTQLICNVTEPKVQACSWISGDALADNMTVAGAVCNNTYLYGVNSIKLAASAAECAGHREVSCELYRDYNSISPNIARKEAMNSFARGANLLLTHPLRNQKNDENGTEHKILTFPGQKDFISFHSRVKTMLEGGVNQCEIALLYPIYYLHSDVYLYESKPTGFEYPNASATIDYMSVINSITMYCNHDLIMLHPETLDRHCTVDNGVITMSSPNGKKDFRILILPACSMISLANMRIIQRFYDTGGKIIATGKLPVYAYEFTQEDHNHIADLMSEDPHSTKADRELRGIIRHIFGDAALDKSVLCGHCHNSNEAGGEAFFLYSSTTAADGSYMTTNSLLDRALSSFGIPFDVILPSAPKLSGTGAFNNTYREYVLLGLDKSVPGGGMVSYSHRKNQDLDILYIANTSDKSASGKVLLRGILSCEIWDPQSGRIRKIKSDYFNYNNQLYTCISIRLNTDTAAIVVSRQATAPDVIPVLKGNL